MWSKYTHNPKWTQQPPQKERLMNRDGHLFVVTEYAQDDPGTIRRFWLPTGVRTYDFVRNYYGDEGFPPEGLPAKDLGTGLYSVDVGGYNPLRIALQDRGRTQAEFVEYRHVPPPKVRSSVELRWSGWKGIWEKSSKSTKWEWVPA